MTPRPIIWSGGQTGVDRAALDAALEAGLATGGWIPRGRRAEDGPIPPSYAGLRETDSDDYAVRTVRNVVDSDATLILTWGPATGGTLATLLAAERAGKPHLVIDLLVADSVGDARTVSAWIAGLAGPDRRPVLNVAGPRASQAPHVYARAREFLTRTFAALAP